MSIGGETRSDQRKKHLEWHAISKGTGRIPSKRKKKPNASQHGPVNRRQQGVGRGGKVRGGDGEEGSGRAQQKFHI